jgi:UDP-N-acetylglucosamine 3-dehydrogenase
MRSLILFTALPCLVHRSDFPRGQGVNDVKSPFTPTTVEHLYVERPWQPTLVAPNVVSDARLRAGLIGLGRRGRDHARVLAGLDGVDLVGIVEPCLGSVDAALGRPVLTSVARLLTLGLDYVVVACPTSLHEQVGVQVANAGVCALIEKPLAGSVEAARRLVGAFESRGLIAGAGHTERFSPAVRNLRLRVELGELGEVFHVVTRRQGTLPHRATDAGTVRELATDEIGLTSWLTGQDYVSVTARTLSNSGTPHEDMVAVVGQLADGAVASHLLNWLSPVRESYTAVTGERGCLVADTLSGGLTFYANGATANDWEALQAMRRAYHRSDVIRYAIPRREPLLVEHELFRDAVSGASNEIVTSAEALRNFELSATLLQSVDCRIALPAPRRNFAQHGVVISDPSHEM